MPTHKWTFKSRFRTGIFGWNGTQLASKRMKEAVSEIKKVAKNDSSLAGEGVIEFMSRLYPACQYIETSSGAFGTASNKTIEAIIPILIKADWDMNTRGKHLEILYQAVCDDGWELLSPVEEQWGKICVYKGLANLWADRLILLLKENWADDANRGHWVVGSILCHSCLLETERYDELYELISLRPYASWTFNKLWAEALAKQGKTDEAIAFAESCRENNNDNSFIDEFCENILLAAGREDEAIEKYALNLRKYGTYISIYRNICKKYPNKDKRQILLDLIEKTGSKGKWFAAAKSAGFLDLALECAETGESDPNTLLRATRDFADKEPEFAIQVGIAAIMIFLTSEFNDPITPYDIQIAYSGLLKVAEKNNLIDWFNTELSKMVLKNAHKIKPALKDAIMSRLQG
ncbi:tetratricopeptide repeat protein [Planctomycetota bacterium]